MTTSAISQQSNLFNPSLNDRINFDVLLGPNDIGPSKPFPHPRFYRRDARFRELERMWNGDFSDFRDIPLFDGKAPVQVNYFAGYSTRIANMMTMSEPTNVAVDVAYDSVIDMTRYGGCVLYSLGGELHVADPLTWYPGNDFDSLVVPYTSNESHDDRPDMVTVWDFAGGQVQETIYAYDGGLTPTAANIGKVIEETRSLGDGELLVVPRKPKQGRLWGYSKYLEMWSIIVEIANRYTRNSRVLDLNGRPIPVINYSDVDAEAVFDDDDHEWNRESGSTIEKIAEGNVDFLKREVVTLPDGARDFDFKQPNVSGVQVSLEQIEDLRDVLRQITGLPSLSGEFQPPSGEALKREFLPLYAETSSMQNDLVAAYEELGFPTEWMHIFDMFEMQDRQLLMEGLANAQQRTVELTSESSGGSF